MSYTLKKSQNTNKVVKSPKHITFLYRMQLYGTIRQRINTDDKIKKKNLKIHRKCNNGYRKFNKRQ